MHPVATVFTFIALLLSFSTHLIVTLAASLMSFFAALLTVIAFGVDIALVVLVKNTINDNLVSRNPVEVVTAPGKRKPFTDRFLAFS